jgi:flagellar export protein FliJ
MPFHFSLDAVLHFRKSMEHQQELRLRAAHQQVARVRHFLEQAEQRIKDSEHRRCDQLGSGMTAAELHFFLLGESALRRQMQELHRELVRIEALRDKQQRIYQQARQEREILDSLRDHQLGEYERNAARREQRAVDDLFLLRQAYLRYVELRRLAAKR